MANDSSLRPEPPRRNAAGPMAAVPRTARGHAVWRRLPRLFNPHAAIIIFTLVLIGMIWFAVIAHVRSQHEDAVANVVRQNDNLTIAFEEQIIRTIKGADQVALFLRHDYATRGMQANIAQYVEHDMIDARLFTNLAVLDEHGNRVLMSSAAADRKNFSDREYFQFHLSRQTDEIFIGKPVIGRVGGHWLIPMTRRINKADGSFGGVVVLSVDPEYFIKFYRRTDLGRHGVVDLIGLDGISRARQAGEEQSYGNDMTGSAFLKLRAEKPDGNLVTFGRLEGIPRYLSYRTLKEYPLMVTVGIAQKEVLAPLLRNRILYFGTALLTSFVVALLAGLLLAALSRQKRGLAALARSEARFRATFNQAAIGIMQTSLDDRIVQANQKLCEMLGYSEQEILALSFRDLSHPDDIACTLERRNQLIAGENVPTAIEKRYLHKDGSVIWIAVSPALVHDADGKPDYFVHMIECITERRKLQENLEHIARHDSLTELPNRALFYDRLQHALDQARRRGWMTGVMFVDLDRFKTINDTLGHSVGDELLQQVAAALAKCVRADDTVGRLGGDEFAVILSDLGQEQNAGLVAQKIIEALTRPFQLERHEVFITASIGIATCEPGDGDVDTMISNADAAMYDAKKLGRNNFQFYAATMSERAMERLLLEKELRYAISRNEFLLNFQPKVNVKSGEISGFEALLRWHRTGGEIVPPVVFIPVVEECGLIHEVGEWVLRGACAQINAWQQAGFRPVPVAVNLSPKQFQHQDICATIMRALKDFDVAPELLEVEITESTAMNDAESAIAALNNIKALGVRIAIDDFGTGYSSLSYLTRFPIDSLKIDRSFVVNLPDSSEGASIARAVITMAHALRFKVIAEGVEVVEQLEFLAANECDEIQGYYFSRPLPAEQATELLRSKRRLLVRPQLVSAVAA